MKYLILIAVMFTSCVVSNSDSDDKIVEPIEIVDGSRLTETKHYMIIVEGRFSKGKGTPKVYKIEHEVFHPIFDKGIEKFDQKITVYYRTEVMLWTAVKKHELSLSGSLSSKTGEMEYTGYYLLVVCSELPSSCENAEYRIEIK